MKSATAKALGLTYNRTQWVGAVYSEKLLQCIGYIYRYWYYVMGESSKEIYKQASVKVRKQKYERLYMMTPEEVIEILKENK